MHPEHRTLLTAIRGAAGGGPSRQPANESFGAGGHVAYRVRVPERRRIAKTWLRTGKPSADVVLAVVESLFAGDSHEEKTLAAIILEGDGTARQQVHPDDVDRWLSHLSGWAEVDSLCQSVFTAEEVLADWSAWRDLVRRLSKSPNVNKRRASLVLLTGPVRDSDDPRLRDLAFATVGRLEAERDILVTKAVSWLLRSMVGHHREAVASYLADHEATLPSIAVRETRMKIDTGTKTRRPPMP